MKTRFRLIKRGVRGGGYYCVDTRTGQRTSLRTLDADCAEQIVLAKNQAERQPVLNLQIAKAYMADTNLHRSMEDFITNAILERDTFAHLP